MQIEAVKTEASAWAEQFKLNLYGIMEAGPSSGKTGGKGSGGKDQQKSPAVDRKEVAVWKLPVGVSKLEFRHWIDTVDTNFDAALGFKYPEIDLDKVKRSEVEVNEENWKLIVAMANIEIPTNPEVRAEEKISKARAQPWTGKHAVWKLPENVSK